MEAFERLVAWLSRSRRGWFPLLAGTLVVYGLSKIMGTLVAIVVFVLILSAIDKKIR